MSGCSCVERFSGLVVVVSKYLKMGLYGILLACAVYWWFLGDILDFWDSFLWIVAFFFIELNLFQWQAETEAGAPLLSLN